MAKKLTARDYKRVLIEIVGNGYYHIQCINKEISDLKITDPKLASTDDQNKLRAMTLTMTLINDLIHPAHKISKELMPKCEQSLIDYCIKAQQVAIENKLIDPCFCGSCKEAKETKND